MTAAICVSQCQTAQNIIQKCHSVGMSTADGTAEELGVTVSGACLTWPWHHDGRAVDGLLGHVHALRHLHWGAALHRHWHRRHACMCSKVPRVSVYTAGIAVVAQP